MIILRPLLLLTNLHLKLLSTQGTGADKLLSTQRDINDLHDKDILSFYIYIILLSKQKKTTTDKHDTHSNQ